MPVEDGTKTGCQVGAKKNSVRRHIKKFTGGSQAYDAVRCARLCRIPRYL